MSDFKPRPLPPPKATPAWLGIDSARGRYAFGTDDGPKEGMVIPGQLVAITSVPHVTFLGDRLWVWSQCARDYLIRAVWVGVTVSGCVNQDPIIAEPFAVDFKSLGWAEKAIFDGKVLELKVDKPAADLLGAPFPLPTLHVGLTLTVQVEHIGQEPRRFLCAWLGTAIT